MNSDVVSAIIGGVSGAVCSGVIYWLLDKRRENKEKNVYKQQYKDFLGFLKDFDSYRSNQELMGQYLEKLGHYRSMNIKEALKKAGLFTFMFTENGGLVIHPIKQSNLITDKDIKQIMRDVKAGAYDLAFAGIQ